MYYIDSRFPRRAFLAVSIQALCILLMSYLWSSKILLLVYAMTWILDLLPLFSLPCSTISRSLTFTPVHNCDTATVADTILKGCSRQTGSPCRNFYFLM